MTLFGMFHLYDIPGTRNNHVFGGWKWLSNHLSSKDLELSHLKYCTILKWMFQVPGIYHTYSQTIISFWDSACVQGYSHCLFWGVYH